jgi:choice-of-anchor B domain-containing protein
MHRPKKTALLFTFAAAVLSSVVLAHEDDRKALDGRPATPGHGIRTGAPSLLSAGPASAMGAGSPTIKGSGGGQLAALNLGKDFPQQGVHLFSWVTLSELWDQDAASNCWGYTSPSGREYALLGLTKGTGFVEVTDPGNPQLVGMINGAYSTWHDVRTYGEYAYAVTEGGGGIQVIDLTQIDSGVVTKINQVSSGGSGKTHTMTINEDSGYLYRAGGSSNGLRIYSLANPTNPVFVGQWQDRYVHAATVVSYTSGPYAGKEIAFCCGGLNGGFLQTGVDILDVTNKNNIQYLSHTNYSNSGYSHQAWPSEDLKYLYVGDELDEDGNILTKTKILDITNLSNPVELPEFKGQKRAIGHNVYVRGDFIFESNYTAGLQVFDASDPVAPVEVAWFDTFVEHNNATFNGLWHVYPYFPSGLVIGSDRENGLFVWWVGDNLLTLSLENGTPELVSPAGQTIQVRITEDTPGDLVPGSQQLHYDAGAGWSSVALTAIGGDLYEASLPAAPCGDQIEFYSSAKSTAGFTWTDPPGAPGLHHLTTSGVSKTPLAFYEMEALDGWSKGDPTDDATGGVWARVDPKGTVAQPGNDHTVPGKKCWVTGNSTVGLSATENDVDGGKTTLYSAVQDLSGLAEPVISYWRWYSNHVALTTQTPYEDVFVVEISGDGTNWVNVETVGPTGPEVIGGWNRNQFRVKDLIVPTSTVQVRFIASDYNNPTLVEAAVDDFEVFDLACAGTLASYCTAGSSASGCQASLSAAGTPSASASSGFDLVSAGVEGAKDGLYFFGANGRQANTWGSSTSYQCVVPPVLRAGLLAATGTGGACDGAFSQDLNALWCASCPKPLKNPGAGAVVQAQLWYRDPLNTSNQTTSLSDALEFTVQP